MTWNILYWIVERLPELIATITGFLYIIYSVERNVLAWPYGIVSSAIYVYIFYKAGIYADMCVYIYYVLVGFYGWYLWAKGTSTNSNIKVSKTDFKTGFILFFITIIFFIIISYILKNHTPSTVPYIDAFITALSLTATWMLTRKIIEHWIIWIVVDSISIGLYLYKNLYPSAILFIVYTVLAVAGYLDWQKEWKEVKEKI